MDAPRALRLLYYYISPVALVVAGLFCVLLPADVLQHLCIMITEDMIKQSFIGSVVHKGLTEVFSRQSATLGAETPDLGDEYKLARAPLTTAGTNYTMQVMLKLRFLDIRYSKGYQGKKKLPLYNRVLWSVLYKSTLQKLRYGLTEDVKRNVSEQLKLKQNG